LLGGQVTELLVMVRQMRQVAVGRVGVHAILVLGEIGHCILGVPVCRLGGVGGWEAGGNEVGLIDRGSHITGWSCEGSHLGFVCGGGRFTMSLLLGLGDVQRRD